MEKLIDLAADLIVKSKYCIAFTGAGISTESGIPDFRGPSGIWKRVDPKIATYSFFINNPGEFWKFHLSFIEIKRAEPNKAHFSLAELEKMGVLKCVITQNVDGLHQKAGSRYVIELHGNLDHVVCLSCGKHFKINDVIAGLDENKLPPKCPECGGLLKPDVILFEEPLKRDVLTLAFKEAYKSDLVLVLGTSLVVYPAAYIPDIVKSQGGKVIIVNLESTEKDFLGDVVIHGKLGEILPKIVDKVRENLRSIS